jgi:hypothetical protein
MPKPGVGRHAAEILGKPSRIALPAGWSGFATAGVLRILEAASRGSPAACEA